MLVKRRIFYCVLLFFVPFFLNAQRLFTRNASVFFDASTKSSPAHVQARTNSGSLIIDLPSAKVEAAVLMKSFLFEKALMQEHFNENYVESSKFPKAVFKGTITELSKINFSRDGVYAARVNGTLDFHGISKPLMTEATFTIKSGKITGETAFTVALKEYGISVPAVVRDKLAEVARVTFVGELSELK
jgi:hypothetical protein